MASTSRVVLALALLGTLAAAAFAPQDEAAAVTDRVSRTTAGDMAGRRRASSAARPADTLLAQQDVLGIRPRQAHEGERGRPGLLFAATQWRAPEAAAAASAQAPAPAAAAAPQAPPLPFKVLGRYQEGGQAAVFLQYAEQNLVVHAGDTIADNYKVEAVGDTSVTLRYLPLDQVQTLELGGAR